MTALEYDVLVVGCGPSGQKAAIQAAKVGKKVLLIDREPRAGGECVHRGTIPSKTLRESTIALSKFQDRYGEVMDVDLPAHVQITSLMTRLNTVVNGHQRYIEAQLERNQIPRCHGRAKFLDPNTLEILSISGERTHVRGEIVVIATGSVPRTPDNVPVDHEHILDSDSLLSMIYLPRSMTVLGSGVIASEYASVFAKLGVKVTMIDKWPQPCGFLDSELTERFVRSFEGSGGTFMGGEQVLNVHWDGIASVVTELESGEVVKSEKLLCALGRVANVRSLNLRAAGLETNSRGQIDVDEWGRTAVSNIFAVGDVSGAPALAASGMAEGRRAIAHALGLGADAEPRMIPSGIYTVPEMACVGLTEAQVRQEMGGAIVGRAYFEELARGQIAGDDEGLLKLVADPDGKKLLGVHVVGEGASELVSIGQMALLNNNNVDVFLSSVFNFPTLAEAYVDAALDIVNQRRTE